MSLRGENIPENGKYLSAMYGPPDTRPAPLNVSEYTTLRFDAMKEPQEKPETVVEAGSAPSAGSDCEPPIVFLLFL